VPAGSQSRSAAELAIRIELVKLTNNGCNSSGVPALRYLPPIVWKTTMTPAGDRLDGSIRGIAFQIAYTADNGWTVGLRAC
jgi:hypothetical protein